VIFGDDELVTELTENDFEPAPGVRTITSPGIAEIFGHDNLGGKGLNRRWN
jgi:hypothetical protein